MNRLVLRNCGLLAGGSAACNSRPTTVPLEAADLQATAVVTGEGAGTVPVDRLDHRAAVAGAIQDVRVRVAPRVGTISYD